MENGLLMFGQPNEMYINGQKIAKSKIGININSLHNEFYRVKGITIVRNKGIIKLFVGLRRNGE